MATYIIADLHLSESKPILTNAFANFYDNNLYLNDKLIIAGDMFDFFVGVDRNSRFQQRIRQIILKAKARGIQTLFQCGNRDFLMDKDMAEYFGMKLIRDFYTIPTPDGQALLIHGDQLCLHDRSYQKFRSMSKNKIIRFVFMALPLSWRKKIVSIKFFVKNKSSTFISTNDSSDLIEKFDAFKKVIFDNSHWAYRFYLNGSNEIDLYNGKTTISKELLEKILKTFDPSIRGVYTLTANSSVH